MLNFSTNQLKTFKLLRESNIPKKKACVYLDITNDVYDDMYAHYNRAKNIEAKFSTTPKWIKDFNDGENVFKILSKYGIATITIIERYISNPFIQLELNKTLNASNKQFREWLQENYVDKKLTLSKLANEYGYSIKALRSACNKFGIHRKTYGNIKPGSRIKWAKVSNVVSRIYSDKEIYVNVVNAFNLLLEGKTLKEVSALSRVSPRFAMRLKSDYDIFRANKVAPYEKIIHLVNEDRLTLREISKKFKLTKDICSIFNENICASLALGKHMATIRLEETRKCIYPMLVKDFTYIKRAKGDKFNTKTIVKSLAKQDPNFTQDLVAIRAFIKYNDVAKVASELNTTEDTIKFILNKYYIIA